MKKTTKLSGSRVLTGVGVCLAVLLLFTVCFVINYYADRKDTDVSVCAKNERQTDTVSMASEGVFLNKAGLAKNDNRQATVPTVLAETKEEAEVTMQENVGILAESAKTEGPSNEEINAWISNHPTGIYDNTEGWVTNVQIPGNPCKGEQALALEKIADNWEFNGLSAKEATRQAEEVMGRMCFVDLWNKYMGIEHKNVAKSMLTRGYAWDDMCYGPIKDVSFVKYYIYYDAATDRMDMHMFKVG